MTTGTRTSGAQPGSGPALQAEVDAWLDEHWDSARRCETGKDRYDEQSWLSAVLAAGYAVPTWSSEWFGRDLSPELARIIEEAFQARGAPGHGQDRFHLCAATIYRLGSDTLKAKLLPGLLTGESNCLLYSEPGAGSDLAGIRTRADRDGDDFVITGQKVWTSLALESTYAMLIARTDWDVPKHKGITFFILPMKQPGIEIRPIHQITGESEFNEVFLNNARVPADNIIGGLNEGWKVLQTALAYERLTMAEGASQRHGATAGGGPALLDFARRNGALGDPVLRQRIARAIAYRHLNDLMLGGAKQELIDSGSSSLMSIGKLAMSRVQHYEARVMAEILGSASLLDGDGHADAESMNYDSARSYVNSIGGGSDQIQRNIISERVLGLPREIEVDRDMPFREVKAG